MITKTNFIDGMQCQRCFWFKYNNYKDSKEDDPLAKQRLKDGEEVGQKVKEIFPKGVDIPFLGGDYLKMHDLTLEAINQGAEVIFEGSFLIDGIFIRVDVMKKTPNGWDIYEVKSSSSLKPEHKEDVGIQWFVLNQIKEIKLQDVYVIILNKENSKRDNYQLKDFFRERCLTEEVILNQQNISETLNNLIKVTSMDSPPKLRKSNHPDKPQKCTFQEHCWPEGSNEKDSIFKLYRMRSKKKLSLYDQGIDTFSKIRNFSDFSDIQKIQIKSTVNNREIVNKKIIEKFISTISYPISYLDFETYTEPLPSYNNQRPNERMPFQFSLHIQEDENTIIDAETESIAFLANHLKDPRRDIADALLKDIPEKGTIITYHKSFEKGVIEELANFCSDSDISSQLRALNNRIVDLKDPFAEGGYYHPDFAGSFSIKKVLPAICKGDKNLNYDNLNIKNGGMASTAFRELKHMNKNEIQILREDLKKYCWLDTYAMYAIYKKLIAI
tara:strand:- start:1626 stop:3119 length:1494 start_codon:yes stop_codon:yes gene_type:complete